MPRKNWNKMCNQHRNKQNAAKFVRTSDSNSGSTLEATSKIFFPRWIFPICVGLHNVKRTSQRLCPPDSSPPPPARLWTSVHRMVEVVRQITTRENKDKYRTQNRNWPHLLPSRMTTGIFALEYFVSTCLNHRLDDTMNQLLRHKT